MNSNVVVVVPVYDGLEETCRCLTSLYQTREMNRLSFVIWVVNDATPNPELAVFLSEYANQPGVVYLQNESNLGFVGSVNRAMREANPADVVLLNSDTEVANDWLDRLYAAAYQDATIGTVTPFSNNAEICSFPVFLKSNELPPATDVASLDRLLADVARTDLVDIPTAVGFCMYIKRDCLKKTGYFDEKTFGRGYGEENDFCMRSAKKGFRHVLCANVFVFHAGGVSFGEEKMKRVQVAMETLDRLYPDYHEQIHQFIQRDPSRADRLIIYIEYLRRFRGKHHKILAVSHGLGGGTTKHIRELADYLCDQAVFLVASAHADGRVHLAMGHEEGAPGITLTLPDDYDLLLNICRYVGVTQLHCHHIMGVHPSIWGLLDGLGAALDVTLHDYYFINGNPTLTAPDGNFCADKMTRDQACALRYPIPGHTSPEFWRHNQYDFLKRAQRIFAPSTYTANLYREYFPDLSIMAVYHPDWEASPHYPKVHHPDLSGKESLRVLVLGAISKEKGADILDATARLAAGRGCAIQFHLLGYAYRPLELAIKETGAYRDEDVESHIREIDPHIVWFPCRWPETYSYTLSAALRAGLPIAAPDLGSFEERLYARPLSWIKPWETAPEEWLGFFMEIRQRFLKQEPVSLKDGAGLMAPSAFRYKRNYARGIVPAVDASATLDIIQIIRYSQSTVLVSNDPHRPLTEREKMLIWFLLMRQKPVVYRLLRALPFNVMQTFKRTLTERPIHEVLNRYREQGSEKLTFMRTVLPGLMRLVLQR